MLLKSNSTKLELQLQLLPEVRLSVATQVIELYLLTLRLKRAKWVWVGGNCLQHSERSENLK